MFDAINCTLLHAGCYLGSNVRGRRYSREFVAHPIPTCAIMACFTLTLDGALLRSSGSSRSVVDGTFIRALSMASTNGRSAILVQSNLVRDGTTKNVTTAWRGRKVRF